MPISPEAIDALIATSHGDLRRAITYLQSASRLANSTSPPTPNTPKDIQEIAGVVPDEVVGRFANALGIEVEGSGMGLAVVKKAVEALGGRVAVESPTSPDGRGTTLRFTWPQRPLPPDEA